MNDHVTREILAELEKYRQRCIGPKEDLIEAHRYAAKAELAYRIRQIINDQPRVLHPNDPSDLGV